MSASRRGFGSNLAKMDAHKIAPAEYDEIPELADDYFERADLYEGGKIVRRGRPPSENPKTAISLRVDAEVVERFRRAGPGWQTRMNEALRKAVGL